MSLPASPEEWEQLEGALFGASLFPYLAFLYFLDGERAKTPKLAERGFRFLLVFVFGSIPAAIAAKTLYGCALADVDPLHGVAESLLTATNLLVVLGFRQGLRELRGEGDSEGEGEKSSRLALGGAASLASLALLAPGVGAAGSAAAEASLGWHAEPANALSIPTWAIHVSSLIEWVIAMGYIWQYAEASGNPRWRGLTVAMIPCHSSGLCAVTWHLLYNAPALAPVVAAQAALTCFGNTAIAFAAWRIARFEGERAVEAMAFDAVTKDWALVGAENEELAMPAELSAMPVESVAGGGRLAAAAAAEGSGVSRAEPLGGDVAYVVGLSAASVAAAAAIKWGSLAVGPLFEPSNALAFAIIGTATAANCAKWARNSSRLSSS